ncbi:hypothetical protein HHI36_001627, partial [Cryptolaemus montrouzieri]
KLSTDCKKAHEDARNNLLSTKTKRNSVYDKNPVTYNQGELVLIKHVVGKKLSAVYDAPYKVLSEHNPNETKVKDGKHVPPCLFLSQGAHCPKKYNNSAFHEVSSNAFR